MIRIDTLWRCSQPQALRAGADRLLTMVVNTLGEARAHHGYLFANARASRLKLLVHDGFGVWCATRRLHAGRFVWHTAEAGAAAPALQHHPPLLIERYDGRRAVDSASANGAVVASTAPCCACRVKLPTPSN